jgi:FAD synthase
MAAASPESSANTALSLGSGSVALSSAAQKALSAKVMPYPDQRVLETPLLLSGEVVKGFGRGSKELGVPTANLPVEALGNVLDDIPAGVYYGWASVGSDGSAPCKMVMSIGW